MFLAFSLVAATGLFVKIGAYTFGTAFNGIYVMFATFITGTGSATFCFEGTGFLINFGSMITLTGM